MAPNTSKTRLRRARPKNSNSPAPRSFNEALEKGWKIHEQLSSWNFKTANKREGFLLLTNGKASSKTLMVRYTALYELGEPYFLEVDRP